MLPPQREISLKLEAYREVTDDGLKLIKKGLQTLVSLKDFSLNVRM